MKKRLMGMMVFVWACTHGFGQQDAIQRINQRVDSFAKVSMQQLRIPGMAIGVVQNGQCLKLATYGMANLEWNNPVTEHTAFQIASCTKLLTSTLLLKAINQGRIRLTDPVASYLDSVPAAWAPLQVKHLISHSSGLKHFEGDLYWSTAAVVKALKDSALEYKPGRQQQYAQFDFMLLGYILEQLYRKPFPDLLRDEVAVPLNMQDGGFDMEQRVGSFLQTDLVKQKAATYYDLNGKLQAYKFLYPQYTYTAGGYFASIRDLVNWAIGLDKEQLFPESFATGLIYSGDSIRNQPAVFTRAGWVPGKENGLLYAGHSGGPGLGDVLRFPGKGYTFIVLTNDGELLPGLARAIAPFYIPELPPKPEVTKFER